MVRPLTEFALKDGISKQGRPTPQPFPPSPSPSTDSFVNHVELKFKSFHAQLRNQLFTLYFIISCDNIVNYRLILKLNSQKKYP